MSVLDHSAKMNLVGLLNDTQECESDSGRLALFAEIGRDAGTDFPQNYTAGNERQFLDNLVASFDRKDDVEALRNLVTFADRRLPAKQGELATLRRSLSTQNIHIITGTKGGIGKTLVSLAIACHYFYGNDTDANKALLTVDLNSTNPDLSRILSYYSNLKSPSSFDRYEIDAQNGRLRTMRPSQPYFIKGGAASFWSDLQFIVDNYVFSEHNRGRSPEFDILVDTNYHVGNLVHDRTDIDVLQNTQLPHDLSMSWVEILKDSLARHPKQTYYIWIFWTWATFQEKEIMPITLALSQFAREFKDRVSIVHVFNPSALLLPNIAFPPTLEQYENELDHIAEEKQRVINEFGDVDNDLTQLKLRNLEAEHWAIRKRIRTLPNFEAHSILGLYNLARSQAIKPPIPYHDEKQSIDFLRNVVPLFRNPSGSSDQKKKTEETFEALEALLDQYWGGRPCNLLLISTIKPELKGYTERFAQSVPNTMDDIYKEISSIVEDISYFLPSLAPGICVRS